MRTNHLYLYQLKRQERRLKRNIITHYLFCLMAYVGVFAGIIITAGVCEDINGFTSFQTITIGALGLAIFILSVASVYYTERLLRRTKKHLFVTQKVIAKRRANLT